MADNPTSNPSADPAELDEKARARARLGKTINGKYRLDSMLGVGGMATVFGCTHRNGSRVALKLLHSEFARDQGIRERFLREGYVANRVDHPGRVAILDDDVTEADEPFLVMELLEGETLQQMWKRMGRKLPIPDAMEVAEASLDTLHAFHEVGIVHRDIKPANIFVTKDRVVKLLDFGVARMREAGGDKTRAGTALGTPSFMAPEQAMGLTDGVDGRADVFSIGATLYAVLSGQRLHQGRSDNEAFILAATQPAPSLARVAPDLPVEVIALVDKALAWDPRNRFETAKAMREECLRILVMHKPEAAARGAAAVLAAPTQDSTNVSMPVAAVVAQPVEVAASDQDPAVQRLADFFRRIERLLPTVRQYGWTHPEADHKLRAAHQALNEALLEDSKSVYWGLLPYSFVHRQQTIWEPTPPYDVVPYNLFAAGIRNFRVVAGVTDQELKALCEVFMIDPLRDLTPEDDLGTALWERQLEHIKYEAINVFAEGDAADREAFYEESDQLESVAKRAADERANRAEAAAMNVQVEQQNAEIVKAAGKTLAIDSMAKKAVAAQLETSPERWSERFVDVLAEALVDTVKRRDIDLVGGPLDSSARDLVLARRFDVLFPMYEALRRAVEVASSRHRIHGVDPRSLGPLLTRSLFGPETLRLLLVEAVRSTQQAVLQGQAASGPQADLDWIAHKLQFVLSELGPDHINAVVAALDEVTHPRLKATLMQFLQAAIAGREAEVAERVPTMSIETARPLLQLLANVNTQMGWDALRRLATHSNATVKCEATAFLAQSPEQKRDELGRLAENPNPEIRSAALRAMAYHQVRTALPLIVKRVQDPSFNLMPIPERRELLAAAYALNKERGEQIAMDIVQKHGLLVDDALEQTRALCAELLGLHADTRAPLEAVLQAAKRRWWNTQPLREAALVAAEAIAARIGLRISAAGEIVG
jgi:predicted Ser/Thr protein kinase